MCTIWKEGSSWVLWVDLFELSFLKYVEIIQEPDLLSTFETLSILAR